MLKKIALLSLAVGLSACENSGGLTQSGGPVNPAIPLAALSLITIDNAGALPAFSDAATVTIGTAYLHNRPLP